MHHQSSPSTASLSSHDEAQHGPRFVARSGSRQARLGTRCQPVQTVSRHEPITSVPERFMVSGQQVIAVVDADKHPIGIIRCVDLIVTVDAHRRSSLARLTADHVATSCTILDASEPILAASVVMAHQKQDFAIVVDGGCVQGMWSAADALAYGRRLLDGQQDQRTRVGIRVREIMKPPPTIVSEESVFAVPERIQTHGAGFLVVVDRVLRPVGYITPVELLLALSRRGQASLLGQMAVAEITSPGVTRVDADDSLEEVATTFSHTRAPWVAVCEGASMVGILRAEDLLSYLFGSRTSDVVRV